MIIKFMILSCLGLGFAVQDPAHGFQDLRSTKKDNEGMFVDSSRLAKAQFVYDFEPVGRLVKGTHSDSISTTTSDSSIKTASLSVGKFVYDREIALRPVKLNISRSASEKIRFVQDVRICDGDSFQVGPSVYTQAGRYVDNLLTQSGLDSIVETHITIDQMQLSLVSSVIVKQGQSITLTGELENDGNLMFRWLPVDGLSCSTCIETNATPAATTTYKLFATDLDGVCAKHVDSRLTVRNCGLFVPDAFTPNSDNLNDILVVLGDSCVEEIEEMIIYGQQREIVYHRKQFKPSDTSVGWNGKYQGKTIEGKYPYIVKYRYADGGVEFKRGIVQLITANH